MTVNKLGPFCWNQKKALQRNHLWHFPLQLNYAPLYWNGSNCLNASYFGRTWKGYKSQMLFFPPAAKKNRLHFWETLLPTQWSASDGSLWGYVCKQKTFRELKCLQEIHCNRVKEKRRWEIQASSSVSQLLTWERRQVGLFLQKLCLAEGAAINLMGQTEAKFCRVQER